jgi:conjugative relaxase-like TrwC/TraI family protein
MKTLEEINKVEGPLRTEAKEIEKMPNSVEKKSLKEALDSRIKEHNESRLDFHKDVRTDGLHSQVKELKTLNSKDPEIHKQIRAIDKEIKSIDDAFNKQLIADGKDDHGIATHRAGFDFTMSAPKSVSVMALVAGDERLIDAHHTATAKAMEYMEKHFSQTRDYDEAGKRERINTGNLAAAQFTHYTSRAHEKDAFPDPQLHTHNLILNATKNGDKWMSLEPQQLYAAQKIAGQIYQNELSRGVKEAGYAVEWDKSGGNYTFEIKGVDKNIRNGFSSRTGQIEAIIAAKEKEFGRSLSAEEKNNVTLDSRVHKSEQNVDELKRDWDESLLNMGHTKESLIEATKNQTNDKTIASDASEAIKIAVDNLHSQKAVFSEHEFTREALKAIQGNASLDEIRAAIKSNEKEVLIEKTDTYNVGNDHKNSKTTLYSSKEILRSEANIEKAVVNGKNVGALMSKEDFAKHFETIEAKKISEAEANGKKYHSLTEGQRGALDHIATSKDKYIGIQGDAGSGKTTALERMTRMVEILQQIGSDHIELIGLAPTNIAAGNIEKDAGIKSRTVDSFIHKPDAPTEGKQQVYLVDESSMLDTVKMEILTQIAEKTGAKVVFIGDIKQLKPVGAGAMFDRLQKTDQMKFAHVTEVLRQKDGTVAKEVVTAFKNVDTLGKGLDNLQNAGKLIEAKNGNMNAVRAVFVNNAAADYAKHGMNSTITLVSTNADRHDFNIQIRAKLIEAGAVDKDGEKHQTLEAKRLDHIDAKFAGNYKVGDALVADKMQGDIKTGMRADISAINREDNTIKLSYSTRAGVQKEKWINAANAANFSPFSKLEKEFSVGDKIAFEKKDNSLHVQNGETAIIKSIDGDGIWSIDKGGTMISFDPKKYPFISHAYAMTVHKSQGQSIDRVHVFADSSKGGLSTNAGYVQMSRAKEELTVYTDSRENLEKQYKIEQFAENAGEHLDTKQFANPVTVEQLHQVHDFSDPKGIEAPKFKPIATSEDKEERYEMERIKNAKLEQTQIDNRIKAMRLEAKEIGERAQHHWGESKNIKQSAQSRSHNIFYASRASAQEKDLKGGIRYQQLQKLEAKMLERGEIDLKSTREFVQKKGFNNDLKRKGFDASQARSQQRLEQMVKDGFLSKDPSNGEKYHLAVSRREFTEYCNSDRAHVGRSDIAQGDWNKALGDKLFNMSRSRTDATLIAGGKWNPKEAIWKVKAQGLYTKDTEEIFNRLSARYERLRIEGVVKKSDGAYEAVNKDLLKSFVGSNKDRQSAFSGEGKSSQHWREKQILNRRTAFFTEGGRFDDYIKHISHVNVHVLSKDIHSSYKMIGAKSVFGKAGAGVVGILLGTTKTLTRGMIGAMHTMSKAAIKGVGKMLANEYNPAQQPDYEKSANLISGQSFEARLEAAKRGDFNLEKKADIEVQQEKSFNERLETAAKIKDDYYAKTENSVKEISKGSPYGGREKEIDRNEREME